MNRGDSGGQRWRVRRWIGDFPSGAEVTPGGVHFRVWAPQRRRVEVVFEDGPAGVVLAPEGNGYFSAFAAAARPGMLYRYRLDDDATPYPDPASRFQPQGPHGPIRNHRPVNVRLDGPGVEGRRPRRSGDL